MRNREHRQGGQQVVGLQDDKATAGLVDRDAGPVPVAAPDADPGLERPGTDRQCRAVLAVGDGLAEDLVRRVEVAEEEMGGTLQPERIGVPLAVGTGLVDGERGVREHPSRSVGAHDGAEERPLRLE